MYTLVFGIYRASLHIVSKILLKYHTEVRRDFSAQFFLSINCHQKYDHSGTIKGKIPLKLQKIEKCDPEPVISKL